jgi:hypothetical protein
MFTFAQWVARLSRGYFKATGKKPDGLIKLKIKMEAAQKVKDQSKVVPFKYKKPFKQEIDEIKPKTAEDFIKKDDWDPSGMASGGRVAFKHGTHPLGWDDLIDYMIEQGFITEEEARPLPGEHSTGKPKPTLHASGGRIGYGLGDFVKKKLRPYTREGINEAQEKWLKEKGLDMTLEEWQAKSLLEKLKIAGKLNLTLIPGVDDLEKGTDYASGGIARVGFFKGKLAKGFFEFVEGLFIKASNDIRLGKGKWKGLDQKQRIVQHDNLTKMVTEFQKTGKLPAGTEQYFGVDAKKAFAAAEAKATRLGKGKNWKEKEVKAQMSEFEREAQLASEGKPVIPLGGMDERQLLKTKYPGISDDLLNKILIDDNPQRKADVIGTIDDYMKLKEIGKSEAEAYDIITKSFSKNPTKHASGGIAGQLHLNEGGRVSFTKGGKVSSGLAHVLGV